MAVVRCVRAHPARLSVAQPRDLSLLTFPATLRRHRRRPFAVNVRIPLDLQCHHFVNSF
eukprot:COSAG03_NODE_2130_length_3093_cov_2.846693_4_plen_58_part_01